MEKEHTSQYRWGNGAVHDTGADSFSLNKHERIRTTILSDSCI